MRNELLEVTTIWDCTKIRVKTATASASVVTVRYLGYDNDAHTMEAASGYSGTTQRINIFAQFIGLCSSLKWSRHLTKSPFLALLATAGSNAAYKIISACSNAVS